ncbi:metal-sensitive transcriptional regulator [Streptococcus ictaluri]|uniref:Metal-sensitive transcriptional repressor n=1 Tax=Streptococcus ictaluri 707-05 TaxID=764299 RepID=G5K003_9STRE|nr:metal-sensitive transcriptional regulator [Streptococcus ictaluri]EHI70871.1 hypothetical protein STRIC_0867 [Streptococcus ictaluri 707-05]
MKKDKKDIINRLKRAEGQLRGVQKMIEENQECFDIMTQLTAIRSSINSTMGLVIAQKITQVIEEPEADPNLQEERINQAIQLIIKK